jgi:hypothetical protein
MSATLKLDGRDALKFWLARGSKRIHYDQGELLIQDSSDALMYVLVWLNHDAFSWVRPEVLPSWVFTNALDHIKWEPKNALASIYGGAILDVPFLELFTFAVLFVLTVFVRLIQDPKRRTQTGAAFAV